MPKITMLKHGLFTLAVLMIMLVLPQGLSHADDVTVEQTIYNHVQHFRPSNEARLITNHILSYARIYNVNPLLATAVFTEESHFNKNAVSYSGAVGISQLMPSTAASMKINPWNEEQNIQGGMMYLGQLTKHYAGRSNPDVYIEAAYNAGPGAVDRAGGIPNYTETRDYVQKVERTKHYIQQLTQTGAVTYKNTLTRNTRFSS